ncbi:MAG: hypothetical protein CL908_17880 [Deltaproteobacteria bacterium]|nr:hypothetical protein [Deltaproteobacteria bacterium]
MTRTLFLLLLGVVLVAPGCGKKWTPPPKERREQPSRPLVQSDGSPSLGSETDGTRKATFGSATITKDTYLCPRQTDTKSFARARLCREQKQGDIDTFETRVQEGRIYEIPTGTTVTLRGTVTVVANGEHFAFQRVEVADGSIVDEDGNPARGRVLASCVGN